MSVAAAVLCSACLLSSLRPSPPPDQTAPTPPAPVRALGSSSLTLDEVLTRARERWPAVLASRERLRARVVSERAAARWNNPSVEVSTENWRPGGRAASDPDLDTFAVLTQPIEIAGQRGARRRMAAAESLVAGTAVEDQERSLVLAASATFLGAIQARDHLRVLEAQRDGIVEIVSLLQRRVEEGVTAEADLRKVEADLGRAAIEATRAGASLFDALTTLGALLGEDPPPAAASLAMPVMPPPAEHLDVDAALARRPDVRAARARAALAAATADLERRRRWPDLLVSAGYKRTAGTDTGVAGVAVPLPIFDRNARALALAAAEAKAAELDVQQVEQLARAELAGTRARASALTALAERVQQELVAPAEVARRAARSSFREGAGDILRYLDAERVHADAAREAIDVRMEAALALVRARVAAGEVWP